MPTKKTPAQKPKKKTLPKDFDSLVEAGDIDALKAVFDTCDINAHGTYAKCTALAVRGCPPAFARWLVDNGVDVEAKDTWGNTALHAWSRFHHADVGVLLALGADITAVNTSGDTALHAAADTKRLDAVAALVAAGIDVGAKNRSDLDALEYALQRCSNADLERMAPVAEALVAAGAQKTQKAKGFVAQLGKTFEFHRAGFNVDSVAAADAGLTRLYRLFDVEAVSARRVHDGRSPIAVTAPRWQTAHAELWDLLVPSSGPCLTVQGEVVRIAGRIGDELNRNGGGNWDKGYVAMSKAFLEHVRSHHAVPSPLIDDVAAVVAELVARGSGNDARLAEAAVEWVKRNPQPVPLSPPSYNR